MLADLRGQTQRVAKLALHTSQFTSIDIHDVQHKPTYERQVICVDNFFTGSKDNISGLIGKPNFELIRHDITERLVLEVDQIYHLACPASPVHYK